MPTYATITLDDRSGYARSNEPVVVSIPLAEADNLTSFSSLAIRQSGSIIPAQFQVISRWGDVTNTSNPIRILQAIFRVASLSANSRDSSTYTLTDGGSGTATGGITVDNAQTNYIEITTGSTAGAGRFRIRKTAGGGHNVLESGEVHTGSAFKTVIATGNASALYLHGVTTAADPDVTTNTQNADYRSSQYTTAGANPLYSVSIDTPGSDYPEQVVIFVTGKFGSTPFQGMNDEANFATSSGADMRYEMRYTFWRESAYVGLDWLIKAPDGTAVMHDAAIDHGGIVIDPNTVGGSGPNIDLFVSVHNNAGTQQGEVLPWASGIPRLFQQAAPNGSGYTWSLNTSGFTTLGSFTQLRESFMVLQRNATGTPPTNDRHIVLMHRGPLNNRPLVSPHGFWHDGTVGCISLWPTEIGEVATNYSRTYHIMPSSSFYRWQGGVLLGDGLYNASTVRSQWKRFCNSPIVPWCGPKYQTSKAFWYLPPATLTRTGQTDWNEAVQRRLKWGTCLVNSADSTDGRTIQSTYDDRNAGQYSFYYWHTYGAWTLGFNSADSGRCKSNRYDLVSRVLHTWMITGLPELWEWAERFANHMCFVCTHHGHPTFPNETGGLPVTWIQYDEGGLGEGNIHKKASNVGLQFEINHNMYKALMYMSTGYQPFKDAAQMLVTTRRGYMYEQDITLTDNNDTLYGQFARYFTFGIEEFLSIYLMQGDATSLQYARNLAINVMCYSDDTATLDGSTIATSGGMGMMPVRESAEVKPDPLWTTYTYVSYAAEAMIMAHDLGVWSRAKGLTIFSAPDVARLAVFIRQCARYMLVGLDDASRSLAATPSARASIASPVIRGHNKTGGNNTLMLSPYEWPWASTDAGTTDTRSTDTGLHTSYTGTCTITGTAITSLSPTPNHSLQDSYLYVTTPDGPTFAVRISVHALAPSDPTIATLASAYTGDTTGTKSITVGLGAAGIVHDGWAQAVSLFAYAAKLWFDVGDPTRGNYLLNVTRDLFENLYLFGIAPGTGTAWDTPFAQSTRGTIHVGTVTDQDERIHGWHTRRSSHFYLSYEQALQEGPTVTILVRN